MLLFSHSFFFLLSSSHSSPVDLRSQASSLANVVSVSSWWSVEVGASGGPSTSHTALVNGISKELPELRSRREKLTSRLGMQRSLLAKTEAELREVEKAKLQCVIASRRKRCSG